MNIKKVWANMAVADVARTKDFYTKLGFKPNGPNNAMQLASFFVGENNFIIHFFKDDQLKDAIKGELADLKQGNEIIFTIAAVSKVEADAWAGEIKAAGGTLVSQPEEFGEGYYGFVFADPDGHKFNVFFMEGM